jgi:hypothetical protein
MVSTTDPRHKFLIAEYEQLRAEINSRSRIQVNLVLAGLTALAAGASILDTSYDVLAVVAAIISILSFLWSDHDKQINTLGAYIALRLEPQMKDASGSFSWEPFFRDMDEGGPHAANQLCESSDDPFWSDAAKIPSDKRILGEYGLLFYAIPFVLLVIYVGVFIGDVTRTDEWGWIETARCGGIGATAGIWANSIWRRKRRNRRRDIISRRIRGEPARKA